MQLAILGAMDDPIKVRPIRLANLHSTTEEEFLSIGFSHHCLILTKVKNQGERLFYIRHCAAEHYSVEALRRSIARDDYRHQGQLPNNFLQTLPKSQQALRAIATSKDEYLLDFINVEELRL